LGRFRSLVAKSALFLRALVVRCDSSPASVRRVGTPSRSQLLGGLAIGLVIVVLGAVWARGGGGAADAGAGANAGSGSGADATSPGATIPATLSVDDGAGAAGRIVVHVAGAVRHPGVYRLPDGTRVEGAIRRAGGPTRKANLDALNLAAKLSDGRQVLVPSRATVAATAATPAPDGGGLPVNLNSATVEELDVLDGIGPTTAQKILDYREAHGGFSSVDELDQVDGIGPARLASLRDQVTV
jgi:competence protein ComEA